MNETVDDLSVSYFDEGVETVKQLDKIVLTKGAWATLMFKHQDWDQKKEAYGPVKFTIRRYQKKNGEYKQRSKFNISSVAQAEQIIAALETWIKVE
jgi:hypothetical protein